MIKKNVVILGSTGSIGVNALDVVRKYKSDFNVLGLGANRSIEKILGQIKEFSPRYVAINDTPSADLLRNKFKTLKRPPTLWNHGNGMENLAAHPDADYVLCGMVGSAGLLPLIAAIKAGKTIGLANKEALVVAGSLIQKLIAKHKATLIPVDSEHSAIYQCIKGHATNEIDRIILTASGGPFYRTKKDLKNITVEEALNHPTWKMGAKITVDSATLMNKGLEAIEAHFLFNIPMEKIQIVIHPQSIVHSLVEFSDGALLAQLSHPDMRLPIQYALTYPNRRPTALRRLELEDVQRLDFSKPDFSRFPCLGLALQAGRLGGTAPTVLSSSNEIAVGAFLEKKIFFTDIAKVVAFVLSQHKNHKNPSLNDILLADVWARENATHYIKKLKVK
jgi:1-deoxy-D-xylulose-5-phosphate reductoisomerase